MAGRNETTTNNPKNNYYPVTNPKIPGFSVGGGSTTEQDSSQFSGIDNPDALKMLMEVLQQVNTGGTPDQKRIQAERTTEIGRTRSISQDYSKQAAFKDAADLMAQNLRQSLERNMPAISKAIQGAGTSQSSMQGLLSQKLATESAQAAGALGAQQAAQYGGISAQLQSVLEALTRKDNSSVEALIKGLSLFQTSKANSAQRSSTNPTYQMGDSGGGQTLQALTPEASVVPNTTARPASGYWDAYSGNQYAGNRPAGTDSNGALSWIQGLSDGAYQTLLASQPQNRPEPEQTWGYGD
jgi:hypothetical protein